MPRRQLEEVLVAELGPDWLTRLADFEYDPLAAASIGQARAAPPVLASPVGPFETPGAGLQRQSDAAHLCVHQPLCVPRRH